MAKNQTNIKIIFFGTSQFAQTILNQLLQLNNFKIKAVVTTPDKPVGRKQVFTPSAVKLLTQKKNIHTLQPEKLDYNFTNQLKHITADLIIVAAYGKIIPQNVLDIAQHGALNIHPSLLPKYRGASPIQAALLNGDSQSGVTIIKMDEKMDHGPIVAKSKLRIAENDTYPVLSKKLAKLGADLLIQSIPDYFSGKIKPIEQNHSQATFCKIIKKKDGQINWRKPAQEIYNQWRALCRWPGIFSLIQIKNKPIKIKFIEVGLNSSSTESANVSPGLFFIDGKKLFIACGQQTALEIKKIQPEGKKIMDAQSFINGYLSKN